MATLAVCQSCREELRADDQVVAAIRQTEVTHRASSEREYVDGAQVLLQLTLVALPGVSRDLPRTAERSVWGRIYARLSTKLNSR